MTLALSYEATGQGDEARRVFDLACRARIAGDPDRQRLRHLVRTLRIEAADSSSAARFSAAKATGIPDAITPSVSPNGWAPREDDAGEEWLELEYARPMTVGKVRVFENAAAAAVARVLAIDESGRPREVWSGRPAPRPSGPFTLDIPPTELRRLRVVIDTRFSRGTNQIDTVQVVGPGGSQWPVRARASSTRR
jgi:hypothetical protein